MVAYARKEDLQKKMEKIYPSKKEEQNETAAADKIVPQRKNGQFQKPRQNGKRNDDGDTGGGVVMAEVYDPAEEGVIYDEGVRDDIPG
ncbi:MAG: hypothetical protein IKU40_09855 [Clostridia bacterium]|nr:hypothetical protein [Clostridia bacterium]